MGTGIINIKQTAAEFGLTLTDVKLQLLRNTVAKDCTDEEIVQLVVKAGQTGLDPFANQICMIRFWDGKQKRNIAIPATTIDGYRAIADRTGQYAPGQLTVFEYDTDGFIYSATAFVKKLVAGTWLEYGATAFWNEYAQYVGAGDKRELRSMWAKIPHVMLEKCAEARAIRRGFPLQTAGLYTVEEMAQAGAEVIESLAVTVERHEQEQIAIPPISKYQQPITEQCLRIMPHLESSQAAFDWANERFKKNHGKYLESATETELHGLLERLVKQKPIEYKTDVIA